MSMTSQPPTQTALAVALWPERGSRVVQAVVLVFLGTLLLALSAKIQVHFWLVPQTMQTMVVMALAAAYGRRLGVITVVAYLLEGFAGLPVFAGPAAGPLYFLGPTGGFLIGFIPAAWIVGSAAERGWGRSVLGLAAAMLVADAVVFLLGFAWLAWFATMSSGAQGIGAAAAWAGGVVRFLPGDAIKIALAACLIPAGWAAFDRLRR